MPYIFKILFIFAAIYILGIVIFRIIFPAFIKWFIKRKMKQTGYNFENQEARKSKKEGQIDIEHIPDKNNKKKNNDKNGEYVDYEEL